MDYFNEYQYEDLLIRKFDPYANAKYQMIVSHLAGREAQKILNVGCGSGELSYILAQAGHRVRGIDLSLEYIDLAWKNLPASLRDRCFFTVSSLDDMPSGDTFDCVIATDVLEHIKDDASALKKLAGLLCPGGELIMTVPAGRWLFGYHDEQLGHFRRYNLNELKRLVGAADVLKIQDIRHFGFTLIPICYLYSKIWRKPYPIAALEKNDFSLRKLILKIFLFFEKIIKMPFGTSLILFCIRYDNRNNKI